MEDITTEEQLDTIAGWLEYMKRELELERISYSELSEIQDVFERVVKQ